MIIVTFSDPEEQVLYTLIFHGSVWMIKDGIQCKEGVFTI